MMFYMKALSEATARSGAKGVEPSRFRWSRPSFRALLAAALAALFLMIPAVAAAQDEVDCEYDYAADTDPAAVSDFEGQLAPYGAWVHDSRYGYVWVPDSVVVGRDFAPYRTAGRWAVTDEGDWVWISDYDWGYIPFHYGRWVWIPARGWAWVPGRVYAPAWVEWRVGEPGYAYIGWAPAPPTFIWVNGMAVGYFALVTLPWWYCSSAWFFHPHWHHHIVVNHYHARTIHGHTHHYQGHGHHSGHGHHKASASAHKKGSDGTPMSGKGKPAAGAAKVDAKTYSRASIPRSPSFADAQVPKRAIPKERVTPDKRALALRKPGSSKAKRGAVSKRASSRAARTSQRRSTRAQRTSRATPSRRSGVRRDRASRSSTIPRQPRTRSFRRPRGQPSTRTSPGYRPAPRTRTAPSRHWEPSQRTRRPATRSSRPSSRAGSQRSYSRPSRASGPRSRPSRASGPRSRPSRYSAPTGRSTSKKSSKSSSSRKKSRSSSKKSRGKSRGKSRRR